MLGDKIAYFLKHVVHFCNFLTEDQNGNILKLKRRKVRFNRKRNSYRKTKRTSCIWRLILSCKIRLVSRCVGTQWHNYYHYHANIPTCHYMNISYPPGQAVSVVPGKE